MKNQLILALSMVAPALERSMLIALPLLLTIWPSELNEIIGEIPLAPMLDVGPECPISRNVRFEH